MSMFQKVIVGGALALAAISPISAQTVNFTTGVVYGTGAISDFRTTGSEMGGMLVQASFSDGTVRNGVWGNVGSGLWGISDAGWYSFTLGGMTDSYDGPFELNSFATGPTKLNSLKLNGAAGRVLFDCDWNGRACNGPGGSLAEGTANSAIGFTIQDAGGFGPIPITATYANLVGVIPNYAVGDLFEQLTIGFDTGLSGRYRLRFDTDNAASEISVVPEPGTYALVGAGLLGLAAVRRRRNRA